MASETPKTDKPIRLITATNADGTHVPSDQVCVSVDADGVVSIAIPDGDIPLHPRAVALVAAAMQLEDESTVASLVGTLQD
ncbi:hypothetical protein ABWH92_07050 [Ahrensia marina]|jgi:hypothetical protein|uniref:hypothetical protein n=1 Tax=Ahrensia marina TaxID=1514904 RepID=UPI0035D0D6A5